VPLANRWSALSARTKALALAFVAVAAAAVVVAIALQRDARVSLFAQALRPEQITEVVERLAEWNVPFVAVADNVRVDARRRNELLLRLSLAGVPHAHVATSVELLEKAGPLTPAPILDAEQRNGLAGDLELALRGVAGIEDAHVIVAPARQATFADDAPSEASASVRLSERGASPLSRDAVSGIRAFVAAAVPGLDPKRVTILDDRGIALDASRSGGTEESASLEASLQSALDGAFGAGATIVRVRVSFDAGRHEVHETRREPLGFRAIASNRIYERYASDKKRYTKVHANEDRGSDVREERTEIPSGAAERISVAVLVDEARGIDATKVRQLAKATVGLMPERGDSVSVESMRFEHPVQRSYATAATALGYAAALAPTLLIVVGALVALRWSARPFLGAISSFATRAAIRRTASAVAGFAPAQVRGALDGEPPHTAAAVIGALPTATATAVLELYSPEERAAIVQRLARSPAAVVSDPWTLLRSG
jgi:flagellar M-ring protein FliF